MTEKRTTGPTQIPVDINKARAHLRMDLSDDDVEIYNIISSVAEAAEDYTGRAFCDQTWTGYYDYFTQCINLHRRPIVSITTVKYIDIDGNQQTLSSSLYRTDLINGRIDPAYNTSWPNTRSVSNAVEVAYVAGYGTTQSPVGSVPADIQHAILLWLGDYFENKESVIVSARVNELPGVSGLKSLLDLNRVYAI